MTEEIKKENEIATAQELKTLEINIAKDIAKKAALLAVPVAAILFFVRNYQSAIAVGAAAFIVIFNIFFAAIIAKKCADLGPNVFLGGMLLGFTLRLVFVFLSAIIVKKLDFIDFKTFLLTVAIGHLVLLMIEMRQISFSISSPGVKSQSKMK